jgi:hypothetical protein
MKSKQEVLAELLTKMLTGATLTSDEQMVLAENSSAIQAASKTAKNVAKEKSEELKQLEVENHKTEVSEFLKSFNETLAGKTFETGNELKNWLKEQVKNVPVLKGTKGSADTNWLKPVNTSNLKPDSYMGIIHTFVSGSPKGVTKQAIVDQITKVKGKCTNKAGYMYRVNMALSGKLPGLVYDEKTKLVTLTK